MKNKQSENTEQITATAKKTKLGYRPMIRVGGSLNYSISADVNFVERKDAIKFAEVEKNMAEETGYISWR